MKIWNRVNDLKDLLSLHCLKEDRIQELLEKRFPYMELSN